VGLLRGSQFEAATCYLRPGAHLVLVTDGVTDAQTPADDFFGDERLEESARGEHSLAQIFSTLHDFCEGRPLNDDCTVVELTYAG
jgi:phosphoserine phosphatase RsbU/P